MKKIVTIAMLLAATQLAAQTVPDNELTRDIRAFHQRAGINIHSYEYVPIFDTPAPKGYKPFYISHYGRHGSRSSGDGHQYARLRDILLAAKADSQLTTDGELLLDASITALERHAGMEGHLTPRGRREHKAIAERMYHRYRRVFTKGSKTVFAASSTVPRCIISMNAFTNSLKELQRDLDIDVDTGERFMAYIGRSGTDEVKARTKPVLDSLARTYKPDTTAIIATLFKDPSKARKYFRSALKLEKDIYELARTAEAFDMEADLFRLLPESLTYMQADQKNMYIYLNHANSALAGDIRIPRASLLVEDIITRADEVIAGTPRAADLRFGHDWPLVSLLCYLGLEGVSERMSIDEARTKWVGSRYTPFAGNLQIIFYRNRKEDVLVKFLMNEKETAVPGLTAVQGPYYRWDDVKRMCRNQN